MKVVITAQKGQVSKSTLPEKFGFSYISTRASKFLLHFGLNASEKIITLADVGKFSKGSVFETYASRKFRF